VVPTFGRRDGNDGIIGVSCGEFMALSVFMRWS